ncbi:MAG: hypothetical protein Q7R96_02215 [Nanoarchaeota archaeon]|nr:hypothetical protein [Nanoarchaeota archaeon]
MKWSRQEVMQLLVAGIVLGAIAGFDDGRSVFVLKAWSLHFVQTIILTILLFFFYVSAQKVVARRCGGHANFVVGLWRRFWLKPQHRFPVGIPLGFIVAIIVGLFSVGKFWFAGFGHTNVDASPRSRFGRRTTFGLDLYQKAQILVAGPLAVLLISMILKVIAPTVLSDTISKVGIIIAVCNMLPIPGLDGWYAAFSSLGVYLLAVALVIIAGVLMVYLNSIIAMIIGSVVALFVGWLYLYKFVYAK